MSIYFILGLQSYGVKEVFEQNERHPWGIILNNQQHVMPTTTLQVDCNISCK